MIDFHAHILPNIDDGSASMEESINLTKEAEQAGFTGIISTSHYLQNYYECDEAERTGLLAELAEQVKMADVKSSGGIGKEKSSDDDTSSFAESSRMPKLYLGNEIYFSDNIISLLEVILKF